MKNDESKLQQACVKWFSMQYPKLTLFAIPNGGNRNIIDNESRGGTWWRSRSFLMKSYYNASNDEFFCGLFVEMKTPTGKQSQQQKDFQKACEESGYKYVICRSFDEFEGEVTKYIECE